MKRRAIRKHGQRPDPPAIGTRSLTARIERIVPGGLGIGHTDGLTMLVPLTAPGDVVQVAIDKMSGNTVFGSVLELVEAGPDRVEPLCPHFGVCGGCDLQHISYDAQVRAKAGIVTDALRRIGKIEVDEVEVVGSPTEWRYRIRAEWVCNPDVPLLGYRKRASREPFDVLTCPILDKRLDDLRARLHDAVHSGEVTYHGEVHAAVGDDAGAAAPPIEGFPHGLVTATIGGERYGFDSSGFFQANAALLPAFVDHVVDELTGGSERIDGEAIDLYCGVGLFTIRLARRFAHVTGVESVAKSASYAYENAKVAQLKNVTISGLPVDQWLRRRGSRLSTIRAVLLDPPRIGAEPQVIEGITRLRPERIVYVSCDPATLARDLKQFLAGGYRLVNVRGFDMFPQTRHVEVIASLITETA